MVKTAETHFVLPVKLIVQTGAHCWPVAKGSKTYSGAAREDYLKSQLADAHALVELALALLG
jgi:hypothetical protein